MRFAGGRRFNSLVANLKEQYGGRVQKVSVQAGFTCPNRDGTRGRGGCDYCDNQSFTPSYGHGKTSIEEQIDQGIEFLNRRYKQPKRYFAYFQSYSNTYGAVEELKTKYNQARKHPAISGLIISTRPDCLPAAVLDYLQQLSTEIPLMLEIGIETIFQRTLDNLNRCHTWEETKDAIDQVASRGITIGGHLILGLPGETIEDWLQTADILSKLPLNYLKLHQFQVVRNSRMGKQHLNEPHKFSFLGPEEYIRLVISFLERLNPDIQLDRLSGEVPPVHQLGPKWGMRSDQLLQQIEQRMEEMDTWQGKFYRKQKRNEPEFNY